jgi:hypothetical protein
MSPQAEQSLFPSLRFPLGSELIYLLIFVALVPIVSSNGIAVLPADCKATKDFA